MSRIRTPFILATTLVLGACGAQHQESHLNIVHGTPVKATDAVAGVTVALVTDTGDAFCTGTLIDRDRVLTAGHCMEGAPANFDVLFGLQASSSLNTSEDSLDIVDTMRSAVHPKFNLPEGDPNDVDGYGPGAFYDLALVKLSKPAAAKYKTAAVAKTDTKVEKGERLILAGFGDTRNTNEPYGILRRVETTFERPIHDATEFEITPGERNSCHGDSGGPAFIERQGKLMLLGVVSRGDAYCQRTGIYTDVRAFGDFINKSF